MMRFLRRFGELRINDAKPRWYDGNSRKHGLGEMRGYAEQVAGQTSEASSVREIAPAPCHLSIGVASTGHFRIVAMDISNDFKAGSNGIGLFIHLSKRPGPAIPNKNNSSAQYQTVFFVMNGEPAGN